MHFIDCPEKSLSDFPVHISIVDDNLKIEWDNKSESLIKLANLRFNCPCAVCEKENNTADIIPIYSTEKITIKKIIPVGNYAIKIIWSDNHDMGIYEFKYLKRICGAVK